MCDQQGLRSACAYAQSDQSLCLSLEYSKSVKLLTEHNLEFLRLNGVCTGSSESTLVKMSHCWKSHVAAHFPLEEATKGLYWQLQKAEFSKETHLILSFYFVTAGKTFTFSPLLPFLQNSIPSIVLTTKYLNLIV